MIENEKIDCVDALIFGLNRTAQWRQKMAVRFPADPRNIRAAEYLFKLATDAKELSDGAGLQLSRIADGQMSVGEKPSVRLLGLSDFNRK
jgi:hypothetical protein